MMPAPAESHVRLEGVALAFGHRVVFEGLDCAFERGAISVLMGGSGSGKSTILRMIGGLLAPDGGRVIVAGREITGQPEAVVSGIRTRLGMLFQNGALLDSMSIFENVALPLRERTKLDARAVREQVHRRLEEVGLHDVDDLLPAELSGGMLRRAALARAIVLEPEVLLCDEPFSGLDPPNVSRIEELLVRLNRELGLTLLVTSHHMASSLRMARRLYLLQDRRCVSGSPGELARSAAPAIAEFIGEDGAEFLARHPEAIAAAAEPV